MIDVRSRRWLVAVHEAGHACAARSFDWRVAFTRVHSDGTGLTRDAPPWLRAQHRAAREDILVSLAGPLADERLLAVKLPPDGRYDDLRTAAKDLLRAGIPGGCEFDMTTAHRDAARLGVALPELIVEARRVVSARWAEIERVAAVLHDRGSLNGRQIAQAAAR